ncbi:MAG: hypothetical protein COB02_17305 [Candidatus Cloacimonadota bacterium]|nr:MAG: hypothetical protein COB02_17305 [Candidatus Cloacimonadota bacterium]
MIKIKIPYGIGNYKTLIEEDYYFVDKTSFIEKLENLNEKTLVFLRPRRFGKSLFLSMLKYYYGSIYKDDFDPLFSKFYIGKKPTIKKNSYVILHFNFSGINTKTNKVTVINFLEKVKKGVKECLDSYFLCSEKISDDILGIEYSNIVLDRFFSYAQQQGKKLYILVDEYDHFANEILSFRYSDYLNSVGKNEFVRKFYEVIKSGTESGVVDRIFMTGVSPITLDSLTSGFNIATHLTLRNQFHNMMGFHEKEVLDLLKLANLDLGLINLLKKWYNGYRFCEDSDQRLFNSDMVLYFVSSYLAENKSPKDMMDTNISSDFGKMNKTFGIEDRERNLKYLDELLKEKEVYTYITREFSLEKEFSKEDFLSLLFYMGVLSIKSQRGSLTVLSIPNLVIEKLYSKFFIKIIEEKSQVKLDFSTLEQSLNHLAFDGNINHLVKLCEDTLHSLSNRDFLNFDEKYTKLILFSYLNLSNLFFIKSEYEIEDGYIDLALFEREVYKISFQYAIELKYIKKSDYEKNPKILNKKRDEAKAQMDKYLKSKEISELKQKKSCPLKTYILVFVGDECRVCEEVI